MPTASLALSFSVDGPGETIDATIERSVTLNANIVNRKSASLSSTTETTIWQQDDAASAFTPVSGMFILYVTPTDGGTLVDTDIFQVSLYTRSTAAGSTVGSPVVCFELTANGVICLPRLYAKSTAPSGTILADAITKVTACRRTGSNTGRIVVLLTD